MCRAFNGPQLSNSYMAHILDGNYDNLHRDNIVWLHKSDWQLSLQSPKELRHDSIR